MKYLNGSHVELHPREGNVGITRLSLVVRMQMKTATKSQGFPKWTHAHGHQLYNFPYRLSKDPKHFVVKTKIKYSSEFLLKNKNIQKNVGFPRPDLTHPSSASHNVR
jgi:hypothetical protein